jgi:hypothetical protein
MESFGVHSKRARAALWPVLAWLFSPFARAEESGSSALARVFEVPDHCGTEADFRRELGKLAGSDAERAQPSTVRIARTLDEPPAYRLSLEVRGVRRELEHVDCRVLFRSAIVVAAASVRVEAESTGETAPPPKVPPTQSVAAPERRAAPPQRDGARGSIGLGAGVAVGVVPGPTAVFDARFGGELGRASASLAARYFLPRHVSVEGRGADIEGAGIRAALGYQPVNLAGLSLGLDVDWLFGEGKRGIELPSQDSAWTVAPSLELMLVPIRTHHFTLELSVEGRIQVQRPTFEVTGFREIYRVPRFGLIALARGVWKLP